MVFRLQHNISTTIAFDCNVHLKNNVPSLDLYEITDDDVYIETVPMVMTLALIWSAA